MQAAPPAALLQLPAGEAVAYGRPCSMKVLDGINLERNWGLLSLEDAINRLDSSCFGLPSGDDLSQILCKCIQEKSRPCTLRLHTYLRECGLDTLASVANSLVLALVGIGCMTAAQNIFDNLVYKENRSWNSLITGYGRFGHPDLALTLYGRMRKQTPWHVSGHAYVALLKACSELKNIVVGCQVHVETTEKGLLESNVFIASALLDMYCKCGFLPEALTVFDAVSVRDTVLWTALIAAYAESGCTMEAFSSFRKMQLERFCPDATTLVCYVKACKSAGLIANGEKAYADAIAKGFETELLVGNTMIDMYYKCGMLAEANFVFDNQSLQSEGSWNALITNFEDIGCHEETLLCFEQMQNAGLIPDKITYVCCLKACAGMGLIERGRCLNAGTCKQGLETDRKVSSALVDMYTGCGFLEEAQATFDKLHCQDVVTWTALIAGYGQCGQLEKGYNVFQRMMAKGVRPNFVTFVILLTACSHSGIVEKGELWLDLMCKTYGIIPLRKHYSCLIDLFGRAGFPNSAMAMIETMPFHPGIVSWHALMSICQRWGDEKLGSVVFNYAIELDGNDVGAYVCMSNIFMQESA